jgi:two-component system sensor histidine kinase DegS
MTDPATTEPAPPAPGTPSIAELSARATRELAKLEGEMAEIDLLAQQARAEATRHEQRRAQSADRLAAMSAARGSEPPEFVELRTQLVSLTKRAAVMEAQVDVLEGKSKVLLRYRDTLAREAADLDAAGQGASAAGSSDDLPEGMAADIEAGNLPPAVSRFVLGAQEDLRREIARAMHDGPAQSLTNIVLQAQIVERLVARDPEMAREEVRQLVSMVQATLDATKSFIFDVRPMVLDDLGLVPTLRRAARDRGRRAQVSVEFESHGQDRRLPMELESGLYRIVDEALVGYLGGAPDRVSIVLDWSEQLEARINAAHGTTDVPDTPGLDQPASAKPGKSGKKDQREELPPALAAMIDDRRADHEAAVEAARQADLVPLPAATWREIQQRARTIGVQAELLAEGTELHLVVAAPEPA